MTSGVAAKQTTTMILWLIERILVVETRSDLLSTIRGVGPFGFSRGDPSQSHLLR